MRIQKAVDTILQQNYGNVPYLISGPPGTGKTKTIVEAGKENFFIPVPAVDFYWADNDG